MSTGQPPPNPPQGPPAKAPPANLGPPPNDLGLCNPKAVLEAHNKYRINHGAQPLHWSEECAEYAKRCASILCVAAPPSYSISTRTDAMPCLVLPAPCAVPVIRLLPYD